MDFKWLLRYKRNEWLELWKILIVSSRGNVETEDNYYGNLNYEARLAADEVKMCMCVSV